MFSRENRTKTRQRALATSNRKHTEILFLFRLLECITREDMKQFYFHKQCRDTIIILFTLLLVFQTLRGLCGSLHYHTRELFILY